MKIYENKKKTEKLAIFKSLPQPFGSVYFNKIWHIYLVVLSGLLANKSARICLDSFGDNVIQNLKSGKNGLVHIQRQEKLADLLLVFPARLQTSPKRFIHISSLNIP